MLILELRNALNCAKVRPKGVKVAADLWRELEQAKLIQRRRAALCGVFDLGFDLPYFEDVILIYDSEIEMRGLIFELPPSAA